MSYLTYASRRLLGDERYEEVKAEVLGSGASALVAGLPKGKDGSAPRAIVDHRVSLTQWQPLAFVAVASFVLFYLFGKK